MESFLVAIHRACNLTFSRYRKLQSFFHDDWERVWNAKIGEWQQSDIDSRAIQSFFANRVKINPEQEIEKLLRCGAQVLRYGTAEYPESLLHIHNPPVLLFCRGRLSPDYFPSISVVGSRKISCYGQRVAEFLVGQLADAGVTIVSGLAFGADTVAHRISMEHGSRTIAVLGNGIDEIYPAANTVFAEKFLLEQRGVLLSEYLPGTEVRPEFFPVRNRIVSGLSRATIVLEAASKSGSLITAELAIQQNKELFVVPGDIFSKNSSGCNRLLVQGSATPALSGDQILQALDFRFLSSKKEVKQNLPKTENETQILSAFEDFSERHIDDLLRIIDLPDSVISSTLSILEIKGLVRNMGNNVYVSSL